MGESAGVLTGRTTLCPSPETGGATDDANGSKDGVRSSDAALPPDESVLLICHPPNAQLRIYGRKQSFSNERFLEHDQTAVI
jgi:hypothetical protein